MPHRLLLASSLTLILTSLTSAQHWPRFRGPNGSGVGPAVTFPLEWGEQDYRWKARLPGVGHSSPVIWGERLFVTCGDEKTGTRTALCLNAEDGRQLWQRTFAGEKHRKHDDNSFASSTPAVDERHLYLCWANAREYLVVALDHDGKEAWRTDLGPFRSGHGFGASPVVHEGVVVVSNDQDGPSALVGLEATTGKVRWKVPRRSKASYSTPCLYRPPSGPAQLICTSYEHGVTSVDPLTGKVGWELDVFDRRHVETPISSPIVANGLVLASCGWMGVRQEVVAVRPSSDGKESAAKVYTLDRSVPLCTTPLVKDNLLFLWSDGGMVSCVDASTGEVHWRERVAGSYYSSPICVGEYLCNVSRDGEFMILSASKRFQVLGVNRLGEGSHSTPALAGGRLYVRTFSQLLCVGGRNSK